jgi:thioredoxin reductase (NADPH)
MASPKKSILETRREQMFPRLESHEIERLCRFGEVRSYAAGEYLVRTGNKGPGLVVILSGEVAISQRDGLGRQKPIVTHEQGSFMGELAQLSGHPALVDAQSTTPVRSLVIPSEKLRDVLVGEAELGERIMRALILRRVGLIEEHAGGPIVVGHAESSDVLRLEGFLARNAHPYQILDPHKDADARTLLERFDVEAPELPIVLCPGGQMLRNPSERELASCIGLLKPIDPGKTYDAVIVGAGPAGLAAAVYAASEGLGVLVLDSRAFGGQAGASARIENYLGFPTGISGMALMGRAYSQARKFGAEFAIPDEAADMRCTTDAAPFQLVLPNDERINTRAVVLACGARYRRLDVPDLDKFEGSSIHYWATALESKLCSGQEVVLVGGGNSAGQAVVFLASQVEKLWLLVRGPDLKSSVSRYLVERIEALPNVAVLTNTEITALGGKEGVLQSVRWRNRQSGEEVTRPVRHLFLFIGADPNTGWLARSDVSLDAKGFVLTGNELGDGRKLLESSRDGVFAIGDVRSGSVKRVAAAVGEGAQVVAALHAHLAELREPAAHQEAQ